MSKTLEITLNKLNEIIEQQAEQIKELEAKLKNIYEQEQCNDCSAKTELPNKDIGCKAKGRIAELEAEIEKHHWIPVSEEMPEQVSGHWGSRIVFATDGKQAWACKYNYSAEYWTAPSGDITHWKPIILPKKDK